MRDQFLSDQLIHSTVRIECLNSDNSTSSGTGFFFKFDVEGNLHIPTIITNKHVFESAVQISIHFSLSDNNGRPSYGRHERVTVTNFSNIWMPHPDPAVDLAILPIAFILNTIVSNGLKPYYIPFDPSLVASKTILESLYAIEDITMVGYPNGIWDAANNIPIVRRGITATPLFLDYMGKTEFVIDAACFPGSSGSPVVLLNEGSYPTNGGMAVGTRFHLLGVLYAGPQHTAAGEIVVQNIPTDMRPVPISRIPNNLGFCIKGARILEFEPVLRARGGPPPSAEINSSPA